MKYEAFYPGEIWKDDNGVHINAHGGGFLKHENWWYWYGEHKIEGEAGNRAHVGVHVYKSRDLYNWQDCGIALDIRNGLIPELPVGCVIERPKVLFCDLTGKFVMWFHYETGKNQYRDCLCGIATAEQPEGPFQFVRAFRPNRGVWPINGEEHFKDPETLELAREKAATLPGDERPEAKGVNFVGLGYLDGQKSCDFTLFKDDDHKAYIIYASEVNCTLHVSELSADYQDTSDKWMRIFIERWMEAPTILKHNKRYYLVMSGCTGWSPNAARGAWSDSIWGPWHEIGNPAQGENAHTTFDSQGCFILDLGGGKFIFAADRWRPENAIDGRYVWLPLAVDGESMSIRFKKSWKLSEF